MGIMIENITSSINAKLIELEKKYNMSSVEFLQKWGAGLIEETFETGLWAELLDFISDDQVCTSDVENPKSINRLIAEARGWIDYSDWEYLGRFDFDEAMIDPETKQYAHIPQYDYDFNDTWELLSDLPFTEVGAIVNRCTNPHKAAHEISILWMELHNISVPSQED